MIYWTLNVDGIEITRPVLKKNHRLLSHLLLQIETLDVSQPTLRNFEIHQGFNVTLIRWSALSCCVVGSTDISLGSGEQDRKGIRNIVTSTLTTTLSPLSWCCTPGEHHLFLGDVLFRRRGYAVRALCRGRGFHAYSTISFDYIISVSAHPRLQWYGGCGNR